MNSILLNPPIAFFTYLLLVGLLYLLGKILAGAPHITTLKSSTYASGEAPPMKAAVPGYRPFFVVALFFAVLHLGVLVLGSGGFSLITGVYLLGLILTLWALILG